MLEQLDQRYISPLFCVETIRQMEQGSFAQEGASYPMMQRAARALYRHICHRQAQGTEMAVVVGGGNNGGDGLLVAKLAHESGRPVTVYDAASSPRRGDALLAYNDAVDAGVSIRPSSDFFRLGSCPILVDGLLGIGITGELNATMVALVDRINQLRKSGAWVVSVDVPSGLNVNTGSANLCVESDLVVTFIADKVGLRVGKGSSCCHEIVIESLQSVDAISSPWAYSLSSAYFCAHQPCERYDYSHKGSYGHVVVVGGDHGMGGAAIMASEAAVRSGAGTVSMISRPSTVIASLARNPSVMALDNELTDLGTMLNKSAVVVCGPGLGRSEWGQYLFDQVCQSGERVVLDADGLWFLADARRGANDMIITPHPGEAARLLGVGVSDILMDVRQSAIDIADKYQCIVVLKGVTTVVTSPDASVVVVGGPCPGLSKGGSGDVLSGIIASCWQYYQDPFMAALIGAGWHNYAAQQCAKLNGSISMVPYELLAYLESKS